MRKFLLVLFSIGLVFLAACGQASSEQSEGENSEGEEDAASDAEPVEIEFWYGNGGDVGDIIVKQVERFNEAQDDVEVNAIFQDSYGSIAEKLQATVVGGNLPDVVQLNSRSWHVFGESDALLDLNHFVESDDDIDFADYNEGLLKDTQLNDAQYALPFNRSTPILYYNKDMMEALGFEGDNLFETWDDVYEVSQAIVENSDGEKYGFTALLEAWYFYSLAWSNGAEIINDAGEIVFDSPEAAEGLQLWADMVEEGLMMPPTTTGSNAGQLLSEHFYDENVGMMMTTTGALTFIEMNTDFELGTAILPAMEQRGAATGGGNLAITSGTTEEKQAAAWEFLKFMTDTEQVIEFSTETGYLPYRDSAIESEEMKNFYEETPNALTGYEQLEYVQQSPVGYGTIEVEIANAMERAIIEQGVDALTALEEAAERVRNSN